jgi:hypothetical protein
MLLSVVLFVLNLIAQAVCGQAVTWLSYYIKAKMAKTAKMTKTTKTVDCLKLLFLINF